MKDKDQIPISLSQQKLMSGIYFCVDIIDVNKGFHRIYGTNLEKYLEYNRI